MIDDGKLLCCRNDRVQKLEADVIRRTIETLLARASPPDKLPDFSQYLRERSTLS